MDSDLFLIISLLSSMVVFIFVLLLYCLIRYYTRNDFNNNGGYQPLNQSSITDHFMGSNSNDIPKEFLNDEESLKQLAYQFDFTNLSPEEQQQYLKGQEFQINHPLDITKIKGKSFTSTDEKIIKDFGINAFKFENDLNDVNPSFIICDKTEINFLNNDLPYQTKTSSLNYPLPVKNRTYSDIIYWETKIFEFIPSTSNCHFAIGLITKPYPTQFRLPGYNKFSISYESTGNLKINKPFPTPCQQHLNEHSQYNALVLPPLQQSDIVGFGYVISTGTIFITRNGKKILDVLKGCFIDLYPAIGCFSTNAKFQVNLGQLGFVWIEANVRKYGFISTSDYKKLGGDRGLASLPQYNKLAEGNNNDKILDKGEELPPRYNPEEELDFFGRSSTDVRVGSSNQHMKLNEKREGKEEEEEEDLDEEGEISNDKPKGSSSKITNDDEELMDLRERIYEQHIQNENEYDENNNSLKKDEEEEIEIPEEFNENLQEDANTGTDQENTTRTILQEANESNIENAAHDNEDNEGNEDNEQALVIKNQEQIQNDTLTNVESEESQQAISKSTEWQSSEESSPTPEVEGTDETQQSSSTSSQPKPKTSNSNKKKKKSGKKSNKKKGKKK
ncbi:unnamed protein product [Candida verbasci]|uniref:B30.2/SPRY domain-containing protein n=1 Tax=Candida verbasci TaxID=1227364 RepID=A0A9W4U1E0_9ASCO|nr:unnamed protein product [Candida verbasci]